MTDIQSTIKSTIIRCLTAKNIHVGPTTALEGVDWQLAGRQPEGLPHSIFQLVNHMAYWQQWLVEWLNGGDPSIPAHAEGGWPGSISPADEAEWQRTKKRYLEVLDTLQQQCQSMDPFSQVDGKSRVEMLHMIANHNSYHLGQVKAVRHALGIWPPPSGGLTW